MPLLSTKGAASVQGFGVFKVNSVINYIEDVFSTYIYTGNSSTQTITNNINLSGKGGLVWGKSRSASYNHELVDTTRGAGNAIRSNTTAASTTACSIDSFTSSGFTLTNNGEINANTVTEASWSFRKQAKFFDIVTYTGTGVARTIAHNLGSTPGCVIVKCTSTGATDWRVYHVGLTSAAYTIQLNQTSAQSNQPSIWNSTAPTSSVFSVGGDPSVNDIGQSYVAYLFAHNAGGFGASGTDNVISCGSYIGSGSASGPTVSLGYEPQFLMIKSSTYAGMDWVMFDSMRGLTAGPSSNDAVLYPNANVPENPSYSWLEPTATGFNLNTNTAQVNASGETYIYVAIRRGPMKTPTLGTSVFMPLASGTSNGQVTSGWPADMLLSNPSITSVAYDFLGSRLQGNERYMMTNNVSSEGNLPNAFIWNTVQNGYENVYSQSAYNPLSNLAFRRAPGFFDEVCYTGTGIAGTLNHNLGVVPELIISKNRTADTSGNWTVSVLNSAPPWSLVLNLQSAGTNATGWFTATSTTITKTNITTNNPSVQYVLYLFASCPGVSKVGSYTGNGSSQTINCGFSTGSRFVMIKRTDSTGDWYVWDSARGIVAGNDPHFLLNSTAAEVTTDDSVDTDNSGFVVNQVSATNVNVTSATYIFLSVA